MYPRIRDLREDMDLNQTKVAKMLGMSQTGYSKYETGENDIPTQILIKLARFYNTSIDYWEPLKIHKSNTLLELQSPEYNSYNIHIGSSIVNSIYIYIYILLWYNGGRLAIKEKNHANQPVRRRNTA